MTTTENDFIPAELVDEPNLRVEAAHMATSIIVSGRYGQADFPSTALAILDFLEAETRTVPDVNDLAEIWLDDDGNLEWLLTVDLDGRPWLITLDEDGEAFATSYRMGDPDGGADPDDEPTRLAHRLAYPLRILATSNS